MASELPNVGTPVIRGTSEPVSPGTALLSPAQDFYNSHKGDEEDANLAYVINGLVSNMARLRYSQDSAQEVMNRLL